MESDSGDPIERAWRVVGRVQGVGFRWWVTQVAATLGVVGRVWNDPDGSVVLHARGEQDAITQLEKRLISGPLMARVDELRSLEAEGPWPVAGVEILR